jgi:predicted ATPase
LPVQLTPLLGRAQEVAAACTLLRRPDVRLTTFTGTGGIGKTRLALQVATDLLAPVSDPDLVVPTIAQTLGLKDTGGQPLLELLKASLSEKRLLLLLDNFEQVLAAAPQLSELLVACPHLKLLVTSRAVLHLRGEHEFPVPPLALPDLTQLPERETLAQVAAVALFLQRARATKPDLQLTSSNARAIAELCVQLDGLPLAIELAAARSKLLPPPALLARLGQRLAVLTSGAQDAPARQQTLRNTIAWSYNLLTAQEQQLFRRLSVFVGGCTLQAVETLYNSLEDGRGAEWILDGVASLMDKSLLQQTAREGEEPRLMMLETIREYGLECLTSSRELKITRQAHAAYYLALAQEAATTWFGPQQQAWCDRLEQEHDNLRAALQWLLEGKEAALALQFSNALWWFWYTRNHAREGQTFLEKALAASEDVRTGGGSQTSWPAPRFCG